MPDSGELNSCYFVLRSDVHYVSFTNCLGHVMPECLDNSAFIILLVRCEIFLIRTDVYCCSQVSKPDVQSTHLFIAPYYGCAHDSFGCVGRAWVPLSLILFWVLTLLAATFGPMLCHCVTSLATVLTFQFDPSFEHKIQVLVSGCESLSPAPFGVKAQYDYFRV